MENTQLQTQADAAADACRHSAVGTAVTILVTFALTVLVQGVVLLLDPRLRFFSDSEAYLQSAASWLGPEDLPAYRERSNFFSILWSAFITSDSAELWIILANGLVVALGAAALAGALRLYGLSNRAAILLATLTASTPSVLYFQHVALSEASAYAATLMWVALLIWAWSARSIIRFGVLGAFTGLCASLIRTSFTMLLLAFLVACVLVLVGRLLQRRQTLRAAMGVLLTTVLATGVAAAAGLVAGSALQGAVSQKPAALQLTAFSNMSGFNLIFKFGELQSCTGQSLSAQANTICGYLRQQPPNLYDTFMWTGDVHAQWATASDADFAQKSQEYGQYARGLLLSHPLPAARIMLRDAWAMLNPINHPRFTQSPNQTVVDSPSFPEPAPQDRLYVASALQDYVRLAVLVGLGLGLLAKPHRFRGLPWMLLLTWLGCLGLMAATAYPTIRLLIPFDPLLIVGVGLAVLSPRSRVAS